MSMAGVQSVAGVAIGATTGTTNAASTELALEAPAPEAKGGAPFASGAGASRGGVVPHGAEHCSRRKPSFRQGPGAVDLDPTLQRRTIMKSGMKDKVEGKFHEAKGKLKEVAGVITGQPDLEVAGTDEKVAGKMQEKVGQIKTVLGK
jgi:uncharacterized protein YjbJ (UPF0337 family)